MLGIRPEDGLLGFCCCPEACCCPQFATGPFPDPLTATLRSPVAKYGANADSGIDGHSFTIPNFTSAECVEYRIFPQDINAACGFVQLNFQLICEGTSPGDFTLTLTGASSGCRPVPTGTPVNANPATAQCDPLFLEFLGFEITDDFGIPCPCNGKMFDVEITDP